MYQQIILVSIFTFIIHFSETLTYSLRLAGVRLGKLAVALSLSGIILLISRTANMLQAPLTGKIIDSSKKVHDLILVEQLRIIILAATFGTLMAILIFPSAVLLSQRIISHLEGVRLNTTNDSVISFYSKDKKCSLPSACSQIGNAVAVKNWWNSEKIGHFKHLCNSNLYNRCTVRVTCINL
jgi:hypothetical protein